MIKYKKGSVTMFKTVIKLMAFIILLHSAKTAISDKNRSFKAKSMDRSLSKFQNLFFLFHPGRAVDLFFLQASLRVTRHIIGKYLRIDK